MALAQFFDFFLHDLSAPGVVVEYSRLELLLDVAAVFLAEGHDFGVEPASVGCLIHS